MEKLIEIGKKYRTKGGRAGKVLTTSRNDPYSPVVFLGDDGSILLHSEFGFYYRNGVVSEFDLLEVSPWEDFKINDPVMVKSAAEGEWTRRYFSGVSSGGKAMTFNEGKTSWSSGTQKNTTSWNYYRRPTIEELEC